MNNKNSAADRGFSGRVASILGRFFRKRRPVGGANTNSGDSKRREKKPLQREIPPADRFPIEALGPVLGNATQALEHGIQAPIALCGNAVLAASHLAAQAHADVSVDGRVTPLSGFFLTVAVSGERKSAVDRVALLEVREFEKTLQETYSAFSHARAEKPKPKSRWKLDDDSEAIHTAEGAARCKGSVERVSDLPPLEPIIIFEEPTLEGLVKNLAAGHPSQGLFSSEGGRFLGSHSMTDEKITATLAGLSTLWDGQALDRVRAGDGAIKLYQRRLSFHLMAQPHIASVLMGNALAEDQGFLSRCLVTMPESTVGTRKYRAVNLKTSPEIARFRNCIQGLLQRPATVEDPNDIFRRAQLAPDR